MCGRIPEKAGGAYTRLEDRIAIGFTVRNLVMPVTLVTLEELLGPSACKSTPQYGEICSLMIGWLFQGESDSRRRPRLRSAGAAGRWSRREMLMLRRKKPVADGRWGVLIDADRCNDCGACSRICGPEAISRREDSSCVRYVFDAARCNGCGDCSKVCFEKAIKVERRERPVASGEIAQLEIASCKVCGRHGAGLVGGVCFECRHRPSSISIGRSKTR